MGRTALSDAGPLPRHRTEHLPPGEAEGTQAGPRLTGLDEWIETARAGAEGPMGLEVLSGDGTAARPEYEAIVPAGERVIVVGDLQTTHQVAAMIADRLRVDNRNPDPTPVEPAVLTFFHRSPDGAVELGFSVNPGQVCRVLASSDLVTWTLVTTVAGTGDEVRAEDLHATEYRHRFYRVFVEPSP